MSKCLDLVCAYMLTEVLTTVLRQSWNLDHIGTVLKPSFNSLETIQTVFIAKGHLK